MSKTLTITLDVTIRTRDEHTPHAPTVAAFLHSLTQDYERLREASGVEADEWEVVDITAHAKE